MASLQELQELIEHIGRTLPDRKALSGMRPNEPAGVAEFGWHGRQYVVTPAFDVFEVKGKNLFASGTTMLIQAALQTKRKNTKAIETLIDTLGRAEESMRSNPARGLALLVDVKQTLARLAGTQVRS